MTLTTTQITESGRIFVKNQNGTSRWWKQIDTDMIVSPTHKRYNFYLIGTQNLETKAWTFTYHEGTSHQQIGGAITEITNPVEAKKWYAKQK